MQYCKADILYSSQSKSYIKQNVYLVFPSRKRTQRLSHSTSPVFFPSVYPIVEQIIRNI